MRLIVLMSAISLYMASCSQRQSSSERTGEGVDFSPLSYMEGDTLAPFASKDLDAWFAYYHRSDSAFCRGAFLASGINIRIDSLPPCPMPDASTFERMSPLLAWSPDSTKAIDIWSYGYQIRQAPSGSLILEGGGPDQMVKVIDRRTRKASQLLYHGPSQVVEAVGWPAQNSILLGLLNIDPATGEATPDLVLIHLGDSLFTNFRYSGPRISPNGAFTPTWLQSKGIQTE